MSPSWRSSAARRRTGSAPSTASSSCTGSPRPAGRGTTSSRALGDRFETITVDAPGHGASGDARLDLAGDRRRAGAAGRPGDLRRVLDGRPPRASPRRRPPDLVERLVLVSASPGLASDAERAERRAADERLADEIERDGVDAFLERWLALPLFARLPPDAAGLDDRRANTRRRAGVEPPARRDRCPAFAVGPPRRPDDARAARRRRARPEVPRDRDRDGRRRSPSATVEVVAGAGPRRPPGAADGFVAAVRRWLDADTHHGLRHVPDHPAASHVRFPHGHAHRADPAGAAPRAAARTGCGPLSACDHSSGVLPSVRPTGIPLLWPAAVAARHTSASARALAASTSPIEARAVTAHHEAGRNAASVPASRRRPAGSGAGTPASSAEIKRRSVRRFGRRHQSGSR